MSDTPTERQLRNYRKRNELRRTRALAGPTPESTSTPIRIKQPAGATTVAHKRAWGEWEMYCGEQSLDPKATHPTEVYEAYIKYYVEGSRGRLIKDDKVTVETYPSLNSVLNHWAQFLGAYKQPMQEPFVDKIAGHIRNYIALALQKSHNLRQSKAERFLVGQTEVSKLLKQLWTSSVHEYRHERLRIQLALALVIFSATAARVGGITESGCYPGSNEGLLYEHCAIQMTKHADGECSIVLKINQRFLKGKRTLGEN